MKIVFIGCVQSSYAALEALLSIPLVQVVGVVTQPRNKMNADFCDLSPLIEQANIPLLSDESADPARIAAFIRGCDADYAFCIGWSRLLSEEILVAPHRGVVGYHPTLLPLHRGRHPIIWAIALGLRETGSTLFLMDKGADSGPVIAQERVEIQERETAASLYSKLLSVLVRQLRDCVPKLADGTLIPIPQDHSRATYWRKRAKTDGCIDWSRSALENDRLIRSLSEPYPGAHYNHAGREIMVHKAYPATPEEEAFFGEFEPPGRVLAVKEGYMLVKCGRGMLWTSMQGIEHKIGELIHG
jgi:methionyl-tRNA formyltransferase